MNSDFLQQATDVGHELRKTEASFDEALLQSSRLMQKMIKVRQHPKVPVDAGQVALIRLARAQRQLIDGTSDVLRVHAELKTVARELGHRDHGDDSLQDPTGTAQLESANAA